MAEYRAHLETVTTAEEAEREVVFRRAGLRVIEAVKAHDGSHGLAVARLRLAERHAMALAARPVNVSGSGGANDAGKLKRRSGHARSK